jgi:ABC-2 type transport system ATP-binding protein
MIETHGLRRAFRGRHGEVEAVAGVDLAVQPGEIFGFLGPNGAGKTTTLRMLTTLLPPSGGSATVAGCDLLRQPVEVRRRIGYVAQGSGSDPELPGRHQVVLQARMYGLRRPAAVRQAAEVLAELELADCADRPARTYSGGQRRRLDLALGLVHRPRLLFLDEPTTGLDPQSRAHLWDRVRRLREAGSTVFLTTHYLDEADVLCDRVAIIDRGRIVAEGTPDALKRQVAGDVVTLGVDGPAGAVTELLAGEPFVREAGPAGGPAEVVRLYVDDGEAALPRLLRRLDGAGYGVRTIALARPSLDDVFLRQTGRSLRDAAAA